MVARSRFPVAGRGTAFVTTTVRKWLPVFSDRKCAITALEQLEETLVFHKVSLVAFVLMPSHVHLLLGFETVGTLSKVMQNFKLRATHKIKPLLDPEFTREFLIGKDFRMWMPRFDDVIIISEKQFKTKIEYIHNNPVKAGLVKSASEYEFSSAQDWLTGKQGPLAVVKDWSWL